MIALIITLLLTEVPVPVPLAKHVYTALDMCIRRSSRKHSVKIISAVSNESVILF